MQEDNLGSGVFIVHLALLKLIARFDFDFGHDALCFDRYVDHVFAHVIDVETSEVSCMMACAGLKVRLIMAVSCGLMVRTEYSSLNSCTSPVSSPGTRSLNTNGMREMILTLISF